MALARKYNQDKMICRKYAIFCPMSSLCTKVLIFLNLFWPIKLYGKYYLRMLYVYIELFLVGIWCSLLEKSNLLFELCAVACMLCAVKVTIGPNIVICFGFNGSWFSWAEPATRLCNKFRSIQMWLECFAAVLMLVEHSRLSVVHRPLFSYVMFLYWWSSLFLR